MDLPTKRRHSYIGNPGMIEVLDFGDPLGSLSISYCFLVGKKGIEFYISP